MKIDFQEQLNRAITLLHTDDPQKLIEAEDIFNALLNLDRGAAVLFFYLGTLYMKRKYNALAIVLFKKALEIKDDLSCIWNNLGYAHREDRNIELAREAFKKAIELKADDADAWMNLSAVHVASSMPEEAIHYATEALKLDPNNANAFWNRSLAYLEKGDYANGWQDYDAGVRTSDRQDRNFYAAESLPRWNGEKGKTVVVYGEQGIGDEIMFASIIPDMMKDCNVILDAHPRLYQLFRQSFPGLTVYGTRKDKVLSWPKYHQIDARIPIGSLGKFYRNKAEDFSGSPYLAADPLLVEKYAQHLESLGGQLKIGISWKGGTKQTNSSERYIALKKWLPIFESVDADFISLQYTEDAVEQIIQFEKEYPFKIHHCQETIDDYDKTAALVSNLDFIISIPQSVVHLAGALGVPTIQLTPKHALWQMGVYGQNMPWYSCVKNIWQDDTCEWEPVIQQAKEDVCSLYQMSIAS